MIVIDGDFIKKLKTDSGLVTAQFANFLAVTPQTVLNWEQNKTVPNPNQLAQLYELRKRIDSYNAEKTKNNVSEVIKTVLVTAGVTGLLYWIFSNDSKK